MSHCCLTGRCTTLAPFQSHILPPAARRWGHEDLWLHTEVSNGVAQQLYSSLGYREVKRDPRFFGPFRRILLRKTLPSRRGGGSRGAHLADLHSGGRTRNGVYVWDVAQE